MIIGIPRALLYYWYGHQWEAFWRECGCEVKISAPTDREVILTGARVALDELCLPVKIFIGHLLTLAPQVDWVMLPHLIKVERDAYICPKFMGLPDLVAHTAPEITAKLLTVKVGPDQTDQWRCLKEAAAKIGVRLRKNFNHAVCDHGDNPALREVTSLQNAAKAGEQPALTLGLLGHPYCLYDSGFNLDLLHSLNRSQVRFYTPEMMPPALKGVGSGRLEKELFWTIGRAQLDALDWMLGGLTKPVDGFIQVTPFACGPEAIVGDLLERRIKQAGKPLLKLNFEEHSGEAGIITRLEAFLDLIKFRSMVC
jgi:predicted nucleotide-binding protein (sugar kinase/HSP70/actin superfamily)